MIINKKILFGELLKKNVTISPEGDFIAYICNYKNVPNIWIKKITDDDADILTKNIIEGIRYYGWTFDNKHIIFFQDKMGNENWNIYSIDILTKKIINLTPYKNIHAKILYSTPHKKNKILLGINQRNTYFHDVYEVDIANGEKRLLYENNNYIKFIFDKNFNIMYALGIGKEGNHILYGFNDNKAYPLMSIPVEDFQLTYPLHYYEEDRSLIMKHSINRNTSIIIKYFPEKNDIEILLKNSVVDIDSVFTHPSEYFLQAGTYTYAKKRWLFCDNKFKNNIEYIQKKIEGEINIESRSLKDNKWIVKITNDCKVSKYYLFDEDRSKKLNFLFYDNEKLTSYKLNKMKTLVLKSRDMNDMVCYYTLPVNCNHKSLNDKLPMIIHIHGGPNSRDNWGYRARHQWLSNRGYIVLSVNFRGSSGFGKNYMEKGNKEWGRRMIEDLIDASSWFIERGIADPDKIALMGSSYGAFASVAGLTFYPEHFCCGVAASGVYDLVGQLGFLPVKWILHRKYYNSTIGNVNNPDEVELLKSQSPYYNIENQKKPLLLAHGKNDIRVNYNQIKEMVEKCKQNNPYFTYIEFLNEGHGFVKKNNRMVFYNIVEQFLSQHLGGYYEKNELGIDNLNNIEIFYGSNNQENSI